MVDKPLVSACIITYNQELSIEKCIHGALLQEIDFRYEILIGDDASTDRTTPICENYASNFPEKIRLVKRSTNLGMIGNWVSTIHACNGKYIALCEGDDYWTDPLKLQKQVDFLEANPDYSICFHRVFEKYDGREPELSQLNTSIKEETYTIEDLALGNFIHTPSVVFRNKLFNKFPEWFNQSPVADYPMHMLNASHGKIKYLPEPMAVYRRHSSSAWSSKPLIEMYEKWLVVLECLKDEFNEPVRKILEKQEFGIMDSLSAAYRGIGNEKEAISTLARALSLDRTITAEWIYTHYYSVLNSLKEKEKLPIGIKQSIRYILKELALRVKFL